MKMEKNAHKTEVIPPRKTPAITMNNLFIESPQTTLRTSRRVGNFCRNDSVNSQVYILVYAARRCGTVNRQWFGHSIQSPRLISLSSFRLPRAGRGWARSRDFNSCRQPIPDRAGVTLNSADHSLKWRYGCVHLSAFLSFSVMPMTRKNIAVE